MAVRDNVRYETSSFSSFWPSFLQDYEQGTHEAITRMHPVLALLLLLLLLILLLAVVIVIAVVAVVIVVAVEVVIVEAATRAIVLSYFVYMNDKLGWWGWQFFSLQHLIKQPLKCASLIRI